MTDPEKRRAIALADKMGMFFFINKSNIRVALCAVAISLARQVHAFAYDRREVISILWYHMDKELDYLEKEGPIPKGGGLAFKKRVST